jgi:hypothetical protein
MRSTAATGMLDGACHQGGTRFQLVEIEMTGLSDKINIV